jgi:enediyne biosynthesis protein E4
MARPSRASVAASCATLVFALALLTRGMPPVAAAQPPPATPFGFVNVAPEAGVTRVVLAGRPGKDHLLDSLGSGAAFLDFNRDGRLDIYIVNAWRLQDASIVERGRNALYEGLPDGTFRDVTEAAGVGGEGRWGHGVAVADVDGDSWPDIFVTNFGANVLYRNLGTGRFENIAGRVGVESPGWNTGASFFDADGDGDLDLYVASYIEATMDDVLRAKRSLSWKGLEMVAFGPFGLKGAPDHYFRNDEGTFVDATLAAGMQDRALAFGLGVRALDMDDDGDVDVFVANDSDPNYLYRNEGNGTFKEVGTWSGCALDEKGAAQASMGVAAGDVLGHGRFDIFVTNFAEDFSTLSANLGDGLFDDVSRATGIGPMTFRPLSWGTAFADLDNDGDLDIVVANGHIYPQVDAHPELVGTFAQVNQLAENRGPGAVPLFRDASAEAGRGFAERWSSRGLAVGDYDNDGKLDLLITHLDAPPSLLRNTGAAGAWLTVAAQGDHGEPNPIGTRITITAAGRRQFRDIASGESFLSTHDPRAHFGLGQAEVVDEVDVRWPDGTHTTSRAVKARQFVTIRKSGWGGGYY